MTDTTREREPPFSPEAAEEALAHRAMFNVVDTTAAWKADLIVRKLRAFSETESSRRQAARMVVTETVSRLTAAPSAHDLPVVGK
jgi:hypothetical protein